MSLTPQRRIENIDAIVAMSGSPAHTAADSLDAVNRLLATETVGSNEWAGLLVARERWQYHVDNPPVVLIDKHKTIESLQQLRRDLTNHRAREVVQTCINVLFDAPEAK